ncbi:MAG: Holliday junction branch migration protein RuvA [Planctomycetes bacterium]|nr:Holliday junction branch migration protein RuvA [Planctomycetota bacterium]
MSKRPGDLVIQVGGIGYRLQIPNSTFERVPDQGEAMVLTYLHVREDALKLFGFATLPEREMFEMLLSVSGIGPGIALAALSGGAIEQLKEMILTEDAQGLRRIKGIGKKTAERIIVELKEAVRRVSAVPSSSASTRLRNLEDAVLGLTALGYPRGVAQEAVRLAADKLGGDARTEDLLREALHNV